MVYDDRTGQGKLPQELVTDNALLRRKYESEELGGAEVVTASPSVDGLEGPAPGLVFPPDVAAAIANLGSGGGIGARNINEFKLESDADYTRPLQYCATNGIPVEITRPGDYVINDTITWNGTISSFRAGLYIAEGCRLVAGSGLTGNPMLVLTAATNAAHMVDFSVSGYGEIDCMNYATKGIWVKSGARGFVAGLRIKNPTLMGTHCGDPASPQGGSDIWFFDIHPWRDGGANNDPNSIGMYFESMTDIRAVNCDPVGFRVGLKNQSVNVDYNNCHPWSKAVHGPMTHGFWIAGSGTRVHACHSDTPHSRNFDGSIDASIPAVYGFFIDAYGGEYFMPRCYLEPSNSVDNVVYGIYINKSDGLYGAIVGDRYDTGTGGTNKFKAFIAQNSQTKLRNVSRIGGFAGAAAYDGSNMGDVFPNSMDGYGLFTLYNKLRVHQDNSGGQALELSVSKSGNGAIINVDPTNTDNIAQLLVRLFRNSTSTDANSGFLVMRGDGTATTMHTLLCNGNYGLGGASNYGGGVRVLALPNAGTVPSSNPTGGGVLYVEAGALKYRGSSGTVTVIAPA